MAEGGIYPWKRQPKDGYVYQDMSTLLNPLPPPPEGLMWIKTRVVVEVGEKENGPITQAAEEQDEAAAVAPFEEDGTLKENEDAQPSHHPVRQHQQQEEAPRYLTRWELVEKAMHRGRGGKEDSEDANGQGGEEEEVLEDEEETTTEQAFLTHTVLPTDTMAGLRLRYKITAAELRKFNDFSGEQFHMLQTLRIPVDPEAVTHVAKFRQRPTTDVVRQQFINATGMTGEQEIEFYLSDNSWKLADAVAAYEEDRAWEEEHHARVQCIRLGAAVAAAASAPPLPAAGLGSNNGKLEMPPPSYSSFFRKSRTASAGLGSSSNRSSQSQKKWSFTSSFSLKKKRTAVYDMDNVVASSASSMVVEDEYVILSSGDDGTSHEGQALLPPTGGGGGNGMIVAMVSEDDHPQTPLLGRG